MKPIVRALAAASVCAILSSPAQADTQRITFSMSGVVEQGRDDLNLFFGNPGEVVFLGGEAYTMSLTLDTADLSPSTATPSFADYVGSSAALKGELTMNGKTLTWTTDEAFATLRLEAADASPGDRQGVIMRTTASGQPGTGDRYIGAWHEAYTFFWPLLTSTDWNQEITFPDPLRGGSSAATSHFEATGAGPQPNLTTWFDARATSATWTVSPVPEPGQYGMLAAGLVTLALVRRRFLRAAPARH